MQQSEKIDELAVALAEVQAAINGVVPDAKNSHFRSKYATLGNIIATIKPKLAEHGLSFMQSVLKSDSGIEVVTQITHKSGQWMRGTAPVPVEKATAHGVGSAITYGRRYSLASILGIADCEDDDGNGAVSNRANGTTEKGSNGLKNRMAEKQSRPVNETDSGGKVRLGSGDPPDGKSKDGDVWVDFAEVPARVLRSDGQGYWDELMSEDPPYRSAHMAVGKMTSAKAKSAKITQKELFEMLQDADGMESPAKRLSEVSIGALARVCEEIESCPL